MDQVEKAIFTNMCMIYDQAGNVLVLERIKDDWSGITFPGGHVEKGESFTDAVIREVWEETGLTISQPQLCGVKQWPDESGARYVVFCYKTCSYKGSVLSSDEGQVYWTKLENLPNLSLAEGMGQMIRVFLEEEISEHYLYQEKGEWKYQMK